MDELRDIERRESDESTDLGLSSSCKMFVRNHVTDQPFRDRAVLDTKVQSFIPGLHTAEKVTASIAASISALKIPKVHIMYLHAPDRTVPFEETCRAINDAFVEGKFERFGLSNYTPEEVEQIIQICESKPLGETYCVSGTL